MFKPCATTKEEVKTNPFKPTNGGKPNPKRTRTCSNCDRTNREIRVTRWGLCLDCQRPLQIRAEEEAELWRAAYE
jgi:hypothetical protein